MVSGAPAQPQPCIPPLNRGCHLPGLLPGRHTFMKSLMSVIQLTSPEKPLHGKWKVTRSWDSSRGGTAEGRPAGGHGRPVTPCGQNGFDLPMSGGAMERDAGGEKEPGEVRLLESSLCPTAGKANRRWTHAFYRVIPSSSVLSICSTMAPITSKRLTAQLAVPCWRHRGCSPTPPGGPCPKQLQEWAPSASLPDHSAKCGALQVSATTCKSPTCGP